MKHHLNTLALADKLKRGQFLDEGDLRLVRQHLVHGCQICSEAIRELLTESSSTSPSEEEGLRSCLGEQLFFEALCDSGQLERAEARALARVRTFRKEQLDALRLLADSPQGLSEGDLERVRKQPRFRTRAVCELLLSQASQDWHGNLDRTEGLILNALKLAGTLDAELYGNGPLQDLEARAWAHLGNLRRLQENWILAEEAFRNAETFLDAGTGDVLARSEVQNLEASLRKAQHRFTEANQLIETCIASYLHAGERHLAGRAMLKKAHFADFRCRPQEAAEHLKKALEWIDFDREPRLEIVVRQLLMACLLEINEIEQAKGLLEDCRQIFAESGDRGALLRLPWSEARIAQAEGDLPKADRLFQKAREGFLREGILSIWALISLDLAAVFAEQQRFTELKELASTLLETFLHKGIHRDAITSLALLVRASELEQVSLAQLKEIVRALERPNAPLGKPS